jgi:hypothetical protein
LVFAALAAGCLSGCGSPPSANETAVTPVAGSGVIALRAAPDPATADRDRRIGAVVQSVNALWSRQFARFGDDFTPATVTVFAAATQSPCRPIVAEDGPTFCRADGRIYISDASWQRFDAYYGAVSEVAQAIVVAHEIGHLVQKQTGTYDKVIRRRKAAAKADHGQINALLENQADCYAGIWLREQPDMANPAALAQAERSRAIMGDDYQQVSVRGYADPNEISHGLSSQRVAALKRGMARGDPDDCEFEL